MATRTLCFFISTLTLFFSHVGVFAQQQKRIIGCWAGLDKNISVYADSMNFITEPTKLPKFLQDHLIDWKLKDALIDCLVDRDEAISLRSAVLGRVTNETALHWIVESSNSKYDSLYQPEKLEKKAAHGLYHNTYPALPFMKYSTRQLADMRLKEIKRIKDKLYKK